MRPGYLAVVESRAREFAAADPGRVLLPLGLFAEPFTGYAVTAITSIRDQLPAIPTEVWIAAGSGMLATIISQVFPCPVRAVAVGRPPRVPLTVDVTVYPAPFGKNAAIRPPYPSVPNFDAKTWDVARSSARPGALIWNVGA